MFDIRPDNDVPGFRVKPFDIQSGDDVPGFRVKATEDVPGFRVPSDGSPRPTLMTGGQPSQGYVNVNSTHPYLLGSSAYPDATIMDKIRDPDWLVPRLGAAAEGAISTIPGVWSLVRGIGRAAGVGGKEEAHRFDDEIKAAGTLAGKALDKAVEYPELATRAVGEVVSGTAIRTRYSNTICSAECLRDHLWALVRFVLASPPRWGIRCVQSKKVTVCEISYGKLLKVTLGCADWEGNVASPDSPQPVSDPERRAWVLGILMGLVLMVAMLQVWRYWNLWAWGSRLFSSSLLSLPFCICFESGR